MKEKDVSNKHLTKEEREFIEIGLNQRKNFTEIANYIIKDRRTISREIQKHKFKKTPGRFNNSGNLCKYRYECKKYDCTKKEKCYEEEICLKLTKPPYVCNGCEERTRCRKIK